MFQFDALAFAHLGILNSFLLAGYFLFFVKLVYPQARFYVKLFQRAYYSL